MQATGLWGHSVLLAHGAPLRPRRPRRFIPNANQEEPRRTLRARGLLFQQHNSRPLPATKGCLSLCRTLPSREEADEDTVRIQLLGGNLAGHNNITFVQVALGNCRDPSVGYSRRYDTRLKPLVRIEHPNSPRLQALTTIFARAGLTICRLSSGVTLAASLRSGARFSGCLQIGLCLSALLVLLISLLLIRLEAQRGIRHSQHIFCVGDRNCDIRSHARQEFLILVRSINDRRIGHHVLQLLGVQPYLRYPTAKCLTRVSINREGRRDAFMDLAHISLVYRGKHLHIAQVVRNDEQSRRLQTCCDSLTDINVPRYYHSIYRRSYDCVTKIDLSLIDATSSH
jgi:hypothetical protein